MTRIRMGCVRLVTWKKINKIQSNLILMRHFVMIDYLLVFQLKLMSYNFSPSLQFCDDKLFIALSIDVIVT